MTEVITSRSNTRVQAAAALGRNRAAGVCLVEGPQLVSEAVAAGWTIRELFATKAPVEAPIEPTWVTEDVLHKIGTTSSPQSPIAIVEIADTPLSITEPLLVLWELADPGNVGTLIRTAAAFGFQVMCVGGADPWAPKVIRAGTGGHFKTPVVRVTGDDGFSALGEWEAVAGVVGAGESTGVIGELSRPAIVVGNEAHGLPAEVAGAARPVTIPVAANTESLNAATSGAILMWEWARSR